jgi:hypothetical protein
MTRKESTRQKVNKRRLELPEFCGLKQLQPRIPKPKLEVQTMMAQKVLKPSSESDSEKLQRAKKLLSEIANEIAECRQILRETAEPTS